jgi:hypothetical protein
LVVTGVALLVAAGRALPAFFGAAAPLADGDPFDLGAAFFFAAVLAFDGDPAFLGLDGAAFFTAVTSASFKVRPIVSS